MQKTLLVIRCFFFLLCLWGSWLVWYAGGFSEEAGPSRFLFIGSLLGALTILVDILLKGFSLRGLTAVTFGLAMGAFVAYLISASPLFEYGDPEIIFQVRVILFIVTTYLATVMALRGRDEFNLVIPYVRFVPQQTDTPVVVLDTSALIDGRIVGICKAKFLIAELVIPRFVLGELQSIADSNDPHRQERGRKGLQVLNELRKLSHLHITIHESDLVRPNEVDAKLIFVAESLRAKLLTTDYNLAQLAEFHGIDWLNLSKLAKAMQTETLVGDSFTIELVKEGKAPGQAVGYLEDGSMVVVNDSAHYVGKEVNVEIVSVIPSSGGKMIFAERVSESGSTEGN